MVRLMLIARVRGGPRARLEVRLMLGIKRSDIMSF